MQNILNNIFETLDNIKTSFLHQDMLISIVAEFNLFDDILDDTSEKTRRCNIIMALDDTFFSNSKCSLFSLGYRQFFNSNPPRVV